MLKGIPAIISPTLLEAIASMGHGDDIAIVDANFPAVSNAQRLIRADGVTATALLEAVLQLLPVDDFSQDPVRSMAVVGADVIPDIVNEFADIVAQQEQRSIPITALSRETFYREAQQAYCIVATGETRLYGNCLIRKGVIK